MSTNGIAIEDSATSTKFDPRGEDAETMSDQGAEGYPQKILHSRRLFIEYRKEMKRNDEKKALMKSQEGKEQPLQGILKRFNNSKSKKTKTRIDYFGKAINRKKKDYHVTFRDIVDGCCLFDVKEVESYKELNVVIIYKKEQPSPCSCTIF